MAIPSLIKWKAKTIHIGNRTPEMGIIDDKIREYEHAHDKSERNKAGETVGLVLKLTKLAQVIDALLQGFDMSIEHRGSAPTTHLVPDPMDVEPFLSAFFAPAKFVADICVENLGAATGERPQPSVPQDCESLRDGAFEDPLSEVANLDCRERLDNDLRRDRAQPL